jgi:hypothetical protein
VAIREVSADECAELHWVQGAQLIINEAEHHLLSGSSVIVEGGTLFTLEVNFPLREVCIYLSDEVTPNA